MEKILTALVAAASIGAAAIATSSKSEAQSRHGRIISRRGTTDTGTDHIPITHRLPVAGSGTVTPGYPPASCELGVVVPELPRQCATEHRWQEPLVRLSPMSE
jgi:hypothetical protein